MKNSGGKSGNNNHLKKTFIFLYTVALGKHSKLG